MHRGYNSSGAGSGSRKIRPYRMTRVDVLIPTCDRSQALAITLTSLASQRFDDFRIIVSDQTEGHDTFALPEIVAVLRLLRARKYGVETHHHLPRLGMAEQRAFLLSHAHAPYCLFLDDDVILEPDMIERLHRAISSQRCGFVGSALHGLSFIDDVRPHQQPIEFWESCVEPETVVPGSPAWARHQLHNAANLFHVQQRLGLQSGETRLYRVAWVGGCVLFDTEKLRAVGGFDFWQDLPPDHCGEDVLAQLRVMACYGGCGLLPSGAYHLELPTTLPAEQRRVNAPHVLPIIPAPPTPADGRTRR